MQSIRKLYEEKKQAILSVGRVGFVGGGAVAANSSYAAAPDFTALTTAVDFSTVITAVLAVAALLAAVYVAMKGARLVLSFVRR